MIQIHHKSDCCGCEACVQVCPKQCITYISDCEGFGYPTVDTGSCIDCGLCEKICPVINQEEGQMPLYAFSAQHSDEAIRKGSSSGGLFTLLATDVLKKGGVVFGARFDDEWNVVHDYTETIQGLQYFRGSKYVQSRIGNSFQHISRFLQDGRIVLFTGTPCQISGLKHYLRKDYDNLLTIEVVCHGVPSPLVWKKYLDETLSGSVGRFPDSVSKITDCSFRDKTYGWKNYHCKLTLSAQSKNSEEEYQNIDVHHNDSLYMQAFLADLSLRPSCYKCPAKKGSSGCDITLGDFWGIDSLAPSLNDDKGCSLLIVHTSKAENWLNSLTKYTGKFSMSDVLVHNPSLCFSANEPVNRAFFFRQFSKQGFYKALERTTSKKIFYRILRKIYRFL